MCSVDDPGHSQIEVCFDPRQPPSSKEYTESMWVEVNRLAGTLTAIAAAAV